MSTQPPTDITVRPAHTSDVKAIRGFIDAYAPSRMLLNKPTVTLYEDVQEFWVAEHADADGSASVGEMAERLGISDDRGRRELTRLLRYLWWNNALTWLPPLHPAP